MHQQIRGYAGEKPEKKLNVDFSENAIKQIEQQQIQYPKLKSLIVDILQLEPRPAYKNNNESKAEYAMKLYDFDLKWSADEEQAVVNSLTVLNNSN